MGRILVEASDHYNSIRIVSPYASNVSRTWVRNGIGTAELTFPFSTPNLLFLITWGRIYRIYEYGVPPWAGVATEIEWGDGVAILHLKSLEWTLRKNVTGQGLFFQPGSSAGKIAYGVFASSYLSNRVVHPIKAGIFDATKPHFKEPYNYADGWEVLSKLAEEDDADVWVDADLYCHFRDSRGTDKTNTIKLREGKHLVNVRVLESIEDCLTGAIALGKGDSIASKPKIITSWMADPGYEMVEALNYDNVTSQDELFELAKKEITKRAYPSLSVDAELVGGEYWGQFGVGDTVQLMLTSYLNYDYWSGLGQTWSLIRPAKVLGMELSGEDRMRLVLHTTLADSTLYFRGWTPTNAML